MKGRVAVAAISVTFVMVVFNAAPAAAEDHGDWIHNQCGRRGSMCNWRGVVGGSRSSDSKTRDSRYGNNYYSGNNPMSDRVENYDNRFSTIRVRSYHDANYGRGSTCIGGGVKIGPYPWGVPDGLSSFKSC